MRRLIIAMLILLICWVGTSTAQESGNWSLQKCIEHAKTNNIQIKQSKLGIDLARENLRQSKANTLPSINARMGHNYNFGRTVDPFTNSFVTERLQSSNFSLNGSVMLFEGFKAINTIKRNKYNLEASSYDLAKTVNDVSLMVSAGYLQILFNQEIAEIAQSQVKITEEQTNRTRKLVEAGNLAKGSLLDIQAQLALDELNLVKASNQLELAYMNLQQLLYLDVSKDFDIVKPLVNIPDNLEVLNTVNQVYETALTVQPQILGADLKAQGLGKDIAIARSGLYPALSVGGSYGTGYSDGRKSITNATPTFDTLYTIAGDGVIFPGFDYTYETTPFSDQIKDNLNQTLGFYLTIPIFNGFQTKAAIARAKIAFENQQYNVQLERLQLKEDIQKAFFDAQASLKKFRASKISVSSLQEAFNYSKQRLDAGMETVVEFNDSKNKLAKSKSELVQSKYDFIYKTKILEFYQGKSLAF
ncbi:MAG: hypothetical protein COB85_02110 [Bacteroidetes bacterium]|nr:MAG: hypothetical protein COB85_02110 [Bacteroidota bacterium]